MTDLIELGKKIGLTWDVDCLMTIEEFNEGVECGGFIDYDGSGYLVFNSKIVDRDNEIYSSNYKNFLTPEVTHVVWYNK